MVPSAHGLVDGSNEYAMLGCSPSFASATPLLTPNPTFSPSAFCSLLNSPDLHQLMSPQMSPGTAAAASVAPPFGQVSVAASQNAFSQFKRRQGSSLAPNMAV